LGQLETRSSALETPLASPGARPGSDPAGAILPGTLVAGRYRIVALAGRGGMGEVYRADDLKLGQPVALKFLPRSVEGQTSWLARFLEEVRIARQIAHPNVCRVYDVGDADGRHFLSMEFIDGEDLASLLRRIGRVPPEKALQIARQLCAGLAAAHEQGVLHRDLKPANVMIDGRGRARITDFGLAGLQERIPQADVGSGTPAYMAPEQLEGREVSVRSDVYSLGLVLYEIFAGRPPFERAGSLAELRRHRSGPPRTPSSHVEGLDPAIEQAILRCLERDPARRPPSALALAAALPGGDPLAAALAAGETPSPEVVAAAPTEGALRAPAAVGVFALTLLMLAATFLLTTWRMRDLSFERSPDGLADRARDLLERLGHAGRPVDRAWGYVTDDELRLRLRHAPPAELVEAALADRAPVVRFWYRESPEHLVPGVAERVGADDPPLEAPGARRVEMTTEGRVVALRAVPAAAPTPTAPAAPDWTALWEAAGLSARELEPATPAATPPDFADTRAAWTTRGSGPGARLRVEGASLAGVPVFFDVRPDLPAEARSVPAAAASRERLFFLLLGTLFSGVLAAGLWLARRNIVSGRADRRGATRIAAVVLGVNLASWLVAASHAPVVQEFALFFRAVAWALLEAAIVWVLYLALEPLLRRRAPASLISWTRLLAGRLREPLVGRDLLLGTLVGAAHVLLEALTAVWLWSSGADPAPAPNVANLIGVPGLFRVASQSIVAAFVQGTGYLVLWQLFSWWLRSSLRGALALGALLLFGLSVGEGVGIVSLFLVVDVALLVFVFTRLGLLASVTALWVLHVNVFFPFWWGPSAWFAGESAVVFLLAALPAAWGAWAAAARRVPAALPA
jgi:serine/threonine-protein kinase